MRHKRSTTLHNQLPALLLTLLLASTTACSIFGKGGDAPPADKAGSQYQVDEKRLAELNRFPYLQMAPDAPPEPLEEAHGSPPGNADEYSWRSGHWDYVDGSGGANGGFQWRPGDWLRKPAFSAVWQQAIWVKRDYGWTLIPGYWE